jgi:uncharacterized alkaline shock family protein YloU
VSEPRPDLALSRSVVDGVVRLAAAEAPGVLRVGRRGRIRRYLARAVRTRVEGSTVHVTVHVVARRDVSLSVTGEAVRTAIAGAIGQVLGLEVGDLTVVVDGVGG